MKKPIYQRQAYARKRLSQAVDRLILAHDFQQKESAKRWVNAWKKIAAL